MKKKKTQHTQGHLTHEPLSVRNKSAFHHYPVPSPPKCAIKTSGKTQKQGEWFIVLPCCLALKISVLRNKATNIAVYLMYMRNLFDCWLRGVVETPRLFTVRLTVREERGREGGVGVSPLGPDRKQMWKFWSIFSLKFDSLILKTHFISSWRVSKM